MAQTRRMGKRNQRADRPKAPRPPTQASARPSLKSMLTERRGRDVGFAESGFRPTVMGRSRRQISSPGSQRRVTIISWELSITPEMATVTPTKPNTAMVMRSILMPETLAPARFPPIAQAWRPKGVWLSKTLRTTNRIIIIAKIAIQYYQPVYLSRIGSR
jgi:hypothetical protein